MNKIYYEGAVSGLEKMEAGSCRTCVTSPPYYGLRDYDHPDQIGLEETPEQYISRLVEVFRGVRRVLRDDGTLWVVIGDSYCGYKGEKYQQSKHLSNLGLNNAVPGSHNIGTPHTSGVKNKDLIGIPWMLAFALRADGWYLRQDIIWSKPNPMPESVKDRCTKSHEYIFLLSKSARYYYDHKAIQESAKFGANGSRFDVGKTLDRHNAVRPSKKKGEFGGKYQSMPGQEAFMAIKQDRNKRSVWNVALKPYKEAHFAVYPPELIVPCILAGSAVGDVVLDPFMGSGTTAEVALRLGRRYAGCELNAKYSDLIERRVIFLRNSMFETIT